jgi:HSP20 family protein
MRYQKVSLLLLPFMMTLSLQANDPFNDPFFKDPFGDNIFKEMMEMQKEMDKMFERMHDRMQQRSHRQIAPMGTFKIDSQGQFIDQGDHYTLTTTIPESKDNQIDISSQNGMISITAKIIQKQENNTTRGYSSSSSMRMYQQSMRLPGDADEATINMGYEDGKLVISVKKKAGVDTPKIVPLNQQEKKEKIELKKEHNSTIKKIKLDDDTSMI